MRTDPDQPGLRPDDVAGRAFAFARRGYEPREVQAFLGEVAEELRVARRHALDLQRHLEASEAELGRARTLDEAEMVRMLGAETVRVLDAAREAAGEVRARAEQEAAELLAGAERDAEAVRSEADQVLERRRAEADEEVADRLRQAAEALQEAQTTAAEAVARAEAEGEAHLETFRERGREMVAEAQAVRERMLRDLSRRRKALRHQIDQLQAARDRLLAAYDVVRRTTEEASGELEGMLDAARDAARDAAEHRPPTLGDPDADIIAVIEAVRAERRAELGERADLLDAIDEQVVEPVDEAGTFDEVDQGDGSGQAGVEDADDEDADDAHEDAGRVTRGADAVSLFARLREEQAPVDEHEAPEETGEPREPGEAEALDDEAPADEHESPDAAEPADEPADETVDADEPVDQPDQPDESVDEASDDVALVARRDEAVAEVERTLARRLKRTVADEQNEVLDVLRRHRGRVTLDLLFPPLEAHVQRYADAALPTLAAAAGAGADFVRSGWPGQVGPAPRTRVGDLAEELAVEVVVPLREAVEARLADQDEDLDVLGEALREVYRDWRATAPDEAASRAVASAFHRAVSDQVVPGTLLRWVVVDDTCAGNAGSPVAVGEAFPDGSTVPPASAGCRCLVVPSAS